MKKYLLILVLTLSHPSLANSAVVVTFSDEVAGTRVSVSGSLDTSGLALGRPIDQSFLNMQNQNELWFAGSAGAYRFSRHAQTVNNWHSLNVTNLSFSDVTGSDFGFNGAPHNNVSVPAGYVSGDPISSSFLINGVNLADISPRSGVVLALGNGDTISVSVIPEPSTATLLVACCTLPALVRRRR